MESYFGCENQPWIHFSAKGMGMTLSQSLKGEMILSQTDFTQSDFSGSQPFTIPIILITNMNRNSESESEYQSQESSEVKKTDKPKKKTSIIKPPPPKVVAKPMKIIMNLSDCQYPVVRNVGKKFKWKLSSDSEAVEWDMWWTDNAVNPEALFKMQPHQKINHFPGMYILSRKNLLGKGLMRMRKEFPNDYKFFPLTWMLPSEYSEFRLYFESKPKGKARTYIVKPEAMSQGKGIFLTRRLEDLEHGEHYVVQRYMSKPYLVEGLKFDLRIYVLIASVDPLRIYIFEEGLARFATESYVSPSRENMEEICMHLTNYAINKDSPNFVFNTNDKDMSIGHKRSLTSLYSLLETQGVNSAQLKQKINDIIIKTMMTGLPSIRHQYRSCQSENYASNMCFEILGFDILLNSKAEPSLLQINYTPSFTTDTPLDELIKFNLIKDTLTIMNLTPQQKEKIITRRRQECNQRVLTGKKPKLTPEQKEALRAEAQELRDQFEDRNLGGFTKVYPLKEKQKMDYYARFFEYSEKHYYESTGIRRKPVEEKAKTPAKPILPIRRGKSTNTTTTTHLQKVQKPDFKMTDTNYYRKKEKGLPSIVEQKLLKASLQQKLDKPSKSEVLKQELKSSTDTCKIPSKKQMSSSRQPPSVLVTNIAPTIVNNINLNFYFQPNPPSSQCVKQEQGGAIGGGYQKKAGSIVNPSFMTRFYPH